LDSMKEVGESLFQLSKSSLVELKSYTRPHPLVEKTLLLVCALKGYSNANWNLAKDLIGKP